MAGERREWWVVGSVSFNRLDITEQEEGEEDWMFVYQDLQRNNVMRNCGLMIIFT